MPKGLFARSLIIIITPVVLLQALVAFVFMERNWQDGDGAAVGRRWSATSRRSSTSSTAYPQDADYSDHSRIASEPLRPQRRGPAAGAAAAAGPEAVLLAARPRAHPGDHRARSASRSGSTRSAARTSSRSASSSTNGSAARLRAAQPDLRLELAASSSRGWWRPAVVLLAIAIVFLRNQIRPILTLDRGGRQLRQGPRRSPTSRRAARARCARRRSPSTRCAQRVERQIEQRTAMLAGVSHDLRTVLTRFRLQLALIERRADVEDLQGATSTT